MSRWHYDPKTGRTTIDSSPQVLVCVSGLVALSLYQTCGIKVALAFAIVTSSIVAGGWVMRRQRALRDVRRDREGEA